MRRRPPPGERRRHSLRTSCLRRLRRRRNRPRRFTTSCAVAVWPTVPHSDGYSILAAAGDRSVGRLDAAEVWRSAASRLQADTVLIDGALQLVFAVSRDRMEPRTLYVPVAIDAIGGGRVPTDGVLSGVGRPGDGEPGPDGGIAVCVSLYKFDGRSGPAVARRTLARVGPERPEANAFELVWTPASAAAPASGDGCWLVLADRRGAADQFASRLEATRGRVVMVRPGLAYEWAGSRATVRPRVPEDYVRLIGECTGSDPIPGIVHFWNLDLQHPGAIEAEWDDVYALGALSGVHLAQALVSRGVRLEGGLAFITAAAQAVGDDRPVAVEQSAIWGAASVLRAEHPELGVICVDVDDRDLSSSIDLVVRELAAGPSTDRVAVRAGTRYRCSLRLVPEEPRPVDRSPRLAARQPPTPFRIVHETPGVLDGFVARPMVRRPPGPGEVRSPSRPPASTS